MQNLKAWSMLSSLRQHWGLHAHVCWLSSLLMPNQILSSFFKAPDGRDKGMVPRTGWEGSRANTDDRTVHLMKLTLDFQFASRTEFHTASEGNNLAHNAAPNTLKEICLGEGPAATHTQAKCSPLPSLPCNSLPQTRTPRGPGHCVLGKNSSAVHPVFFTQTFLPLQPGSVCF